MPGSNTVNDKVLIAGVFQNNTIGRIQQEYHFRTILLAVYNKNIIESDDFLGEARISLSEFKHFHEIDNWFPLADLVCNSINSLPQFEQRDL